MSKIQDIIDKAESHLARIDDDALIDVFRSLIEAIKLLARGQQQAMKDIEGIGNSLGPQPGDRWAH